MTTDPKDLLEALKALAANTPAAPPPPPIDPEVLRAALERSKNSAVEVAEYDGEGRIIGQHKVNRVAWYKFRPKDVSIRTTGNDKTDTALFDMPLHVDADQALRILNLDFSLEIDLDEPEPEEGAETEATAPDLSKTSMVTLRKLAKDNGLTVPFGAKRDAVLSALQEAGIAA